MRNKQQILFVEALEEICQVCSRPLPEQYLDKLDSEESVIGWGEKLSVTENPAPMKI